MEGLDFIPFKGGGQEGRAVLAAARRAATEGIGARVQRLTAAPDDDFSLTDNGQFRWEGVPIGRLARARHRSLLTFGLATVSSSKMA